jgi:hypothetical protein
MAGDYLAELAALTGLHSYPKQGPFGDKAGAAMGNREGYLLAVGQTKAENGHSAIAILVRFPEVQETDTLKEELKQAMKGRSGKASLVASSAVRWVDTYSFGKPNAQKIADLVPPLLEAVKKVTPGFAGKCEVCKSASTPEISLRSGVPGYYCPSCQQKIQMELSAAGQAYEEKSINYVNGVVFGVLAALAGSLAWGGIAFLANRIFLWGAILIGGMVAWAVVKGAGKVAPLIHVLIGVLTLASVLFGDVLFFTFMVMKEMKLSFSLDLVKRVLASFWTLETSGGRGGIATLLFALGGAAYAVYHLRKPKFEAEFKPLSPSAP